MWQEQLKVLQRKVVSMCINVNSSLATQIKNTTLSKAKKWNMWCLFIAVAVDFQIKLALQPAAVLVAMYLQRTVLFGEEASWEDLCVVLHAH